MDIDLNKVPKQFTDKQVFGFGKDHFVIGMVCGNNLSSFVLGRTNGKEFLQSLLKVVEESEKLFGPISVESGMISPIQFPKPENGSDSEKGNQLKGKK